MPQCGGCQKGGPRYPITPNGIDDESIVVNFVANERVYARFGRHAQIQGDGIVSMGTLDRLGGDAVEQGPQRRCPTRHRDDCWNDPRTNGGSKLVTRRLYAEIVEQGFVVDPVQGRTTTHLVFSCTRVLEGLGRGGKDHQVTGTPRNLAIIERRGIPRSPNDIERLRRCPGGSRQGFPPHDAKETGHQIGRRARVINL
eukprot:scaffold34695_cov266-Amphora_coffeaeformis.AAC.10